jgi:hypothetical protein
MVGVIVTVLRRVRMPGVQTGRRVVAVNPFDRPVASLRKGHHRAVRQAHHAEQYRQGETAKSRCGPVPCHGTHIVLAECCRKGVSLT